MERRTFARTETFWWAQHAWNQDCVNVFVVRYTWRDSEAVPSLAQYLDANGHWVEYGPGCAIEPTLQVNGFVASFLGGTERVPTELTEKVNQMLETAWRH